MNTSAVIWRSQSETKPSADAYDQHAAAECQMEQLSDNLLPDKVNRAILKGRCDPCPQAVTKAPFTWQYHFNKPGMSCGHSS